MIKKAELFRYTTPESVKVRLSSKVQFQRGPEPAADELSNELLIQLVRDAESDVELALCARYAIPFHHRVVGDFDDLPDTTKRQIRKVVDLRATVLILDLDFGRGSAVEGETYSRPATKQYEDAISLLLGKEKAPTTSERDRSRMTPPLPGLRLAPTNRADRGVFGAVINTDASPSLGSYAADQMSDPSRTFGPSRRRGGNLL